MNISVIIPAYNAGKYLARCVDSIIAQTVSPGEVIIVVDGATDNTLDVASAYGDRFPELVRVVLRVNGGVSRARNDGIDCARGKYICFVDADDSLDDLYIESHLKALQSTGADISFGRICEFDDSASWDSWVNAYVDNLDVRLVYPATEKLLGFTPVWGKVYRLSTVRDLRFIEDCVHEDNGYSVIALSRAASVVICTGAIYRYYIQPVNGGSIMGGLGFDSFSDLLTVQARVVAELTRCKISWRFFSVVILGQLIAVEVYVKCLNENKLRMWRVALLSNVRSVRLSNMLPILLGCVRYIVFKFK